MNKKDLEKLTETIERCLNIWKHQQPCPRIPRTKKNQLAINEIIQDCCSEYNLVCEKVSLIQTLPDYDFQVKYLKVKEKKDGSE